MVTTSIIFDHRNRAKGKNDKGPIEVRVTVDRKPYYINTGIKVKRSQFHDGIVSLPKNSKETNDEINIIVNKIRCEIIACVEHNRKIDVAEIRRKVWEQPDDKPAMLDWMTKEIENLNLVEGTIKHYRSMVNRLIEFGQMKRWQDATVENIYLFDKYLHTLKRWKTITDKEAGRKPQPLNANTIHNYHKDLKAMLWRAVKLGLIDKNPYEKLRGEFKRTESESIEYLSRDEVERLEAVHVEPGGMIEAARDLFVFQLYTGLAYADTQVFTINDYREIEGRWVNIGERVKTGVSYVSMLLPPAIEVLKKYNMATPKMSSQVYNRQLKILGVLAKIDRPLHSHMARHTFATWMLSNGAKIENVSRMLGHTNIRQTQRYARVLAKDVMADYDRMEKSLTDKSNGKKRNGVSRNGCADVRLRKNKSE